MKQKITAILRAIGKFLGRIFRRKNRQGGKKPKFRLLPNFWILVCLIPLALIFTQALISPVSSVIFVFVVTLPIISLLYILLAIPAIKIYLDNETSEVEKMTEAGFSLAITNESPVPFPFLEAEITVPSRKGTRSESTRTMLSLIPFGSYVIENRAVFKYRGQYDIGVSDIYVYDFFRFFCLRIELNMFRDIFVLPRRLLMPGTNGNDATVENTDSIIRRVGSDNTETSDIRTYIEGDSLRSIHWKLSSKTQDLMVKQYSRNSEQQIYIFCDTARRYDPEDKRFEEDVNEYTADGVVEAAIAVINHNLRKPNAAVSLVWFDSRGVNNVCFARLTSTADFDGIFRLFATSPVTNTAQSLAELTAITQESDASGLSLIYITGCADKNFASSLAGVSSVGAAGTEAYIYSPMEKVLDEYKSEISDEIELCINELSKNGITVRSAHFDASASAFGKGADKK